MQLWSSFHLVLHMELSVLNLLFQWFRYHVSHILQKTSGSLFPWDNIKSVTGRAEPEERAEDLVEGCWSLQSSVYVAKNDTWNLYSKVSSELAQLSDDRQMYIVYKQLRGITARQDHLGSQMVNPETGHLWGCRFIVTIPTLLSS